MINDIVLLVNCIPAVLILTGFCWWAGKSFIKKQKRDEIMEDKILQQMKFGDYVQKEPQQQFITENQVIRLIQNHNTPGYIQQNCMNEALMETLKKK